MKNLKYQKFIFIFIFILSIDKSFEQFCTDTYCTINTDTGSNTYSIERNSYTNSIKYRPKYLQTDDNTGRVSCHDCPEISIGSIYSIDANGNCYVGQCPEGGKILELYIYFTIYSISYGEQIDPSIFSIVFSK